jgi:4-hydroxy-tetrahydrodipicolinate synthase
LKEKKHPGGVVIPMVTPLLDNGEIDRTSLSKMLDLYIDANTIPFILGTTGEAASLSLKQRETMVRETAGIVAGRSRLYAGIYDTCFENILAQAEVYARLGITTFVAHLPAYYPLTPVQIENYFLLLADLLPGELIVYNIPATTKVSIPIGIIGSLSRHPKIIGLKDSERSAERMEKLASLFSEREDMTIYSGWTHRSTFALGLGFDGIVPSTGNLIPHRFYDLYQAVFERNTPLAEKMQAGIDPIADFHQKDRVLSDGIILLKLMMAELGLCGPDVLPPLQRFSPEEEKRVRESFRKLEIH